MISGERPVNGGDLKILRSKLGMGIREFCNLLGISAIIYHKLVKDEALGEPIKDAALAILVRWFDAHPNEVERQRVPTFVELSQMFSEVTSEMGDLQLVTMLGRNFTSLYRYQAVRKGNPNVRSANGIAKAAYVAFERMLKNGGAKGLAKWIEVVNKEGYARGAQSDMVGPKARSSVVWPRAGGIKRGGGKKKTRD